MSSARGLLYGRQRVSRLERPVQNAFQWSLDLLANLPHAELSTSFHFPEANVVSHTARLVAMPSGKAYQGHLALMKMDDGQMGWLAFTTYGPANTPHRSKFVEYHGSCLDTAIENINNKIEKKLKKGYEAEFAYNDEQLDRRKVIKQIQERIDDKHLSDLLPKHL